MGRSILFHHIPKCGGQSVAAGMVLSYDPWSVLSRFSLDAAAAAKAAAALGQDRFAYRRDLLAYALARGRGRVVYGHYPFCRRAYEAFREDWMFVMLFRDPVARWYSDYFWNRYKNHSHDRTTLDIEAYLDSPQGRAGTRVFVNYLATCADPAGPVAIEEAADAIEALALLDVVGTLEQLPQFQAAMRAATGRSLWMPPAINKSPAPADVKCPGKDSAFHKKLLMLLEADRAVYRVVLDRVKGVHHV